MTALGKKALLLALSVGIVIGSAGSTASASFADSSSVATSLTTGTVTAPTDLVGKLTCPAKGDYATMAATWTPSPSPGVTGYLVHVHFSDGFTQTEQIAAGATSWSKPIAKYNVTLWAVQYSVTTQTSYGWTAETPKTGWFQC